MKIIGAPSFDEWDDEYQSLTINPSFSFPSVCTTACCQTDLFIAKLVRADPRSWGGRLGHHFQTVAGISCLCLAPDVCLTFCWCLCWWRWRSCPGCWPSRSGWWHQSFPSFWTTRVCPVLIILTETLTGNAQQISDQGVSSCLPHLLRPSRGFSHLLSPRVQRDPSLFLLPFTALSESRNRHINKLNLQDRTGGQFTVMSWLLATFHIYQPLTSLFDLTNSTSTRTTRRRT